MFLFEKLHFRGPLLRCIRNGFPRFSPVEPIIIQSEERHTLITFLQKTLKKILSGSRQSDSSCAATHGKVEDGQDNVGQGNRIIHVKEIKHERDGGEAGAAAVTLRAGEENPLKSKRRRPRTRSRSDKRSKPASDQQDLATTLPALHDVPQVDGKMRFVDLDIPAEILCGIQDLNFQYCTPIQEQCLPYALTGRDVTGKAQTGTGKTAAFVTAALTHLLRHPKETRKPGSCRVLVLAPTRELAIQIHKDAEDLGKYCGLTNLVVYGGMGYQKQREGLEKPIDVLVGTPGRILDYCSSGHLHLSGTEILVIDEADRMLDMGFMPDVRRIVSKTPPAGKRQTMFFSATLKGEIIDLVDRWLVDPVRIETETETVITDLIEQKFYSVCRDDKLALILWIIRNDNVGRMLVFCNRKDSAQRLALALQRHGIQTGVLSGDIPQQKRLLILDQFRAGRTPVIVATDVAARGIHVDSVSHVILYDLPDDPEDYIHRIGRTGRAGENGKSISFACEYGSYVIPELEKLLACKIDCINPTEEMTILPSASAAQRNRRSPRRRTPDGGPRSRGRRPSDEAVSRAEREETAHV